MPVATEEDRLLTPEELGAFFRVGKETALRWLRQRRIASVRTPGGQRRVRESALRAFLEQSSSEAGDRDE